MDGIQDAAITITHSLAMNQKETGALIGISGKYCGTYFRIRPKQRIWIGRDYNVVDFVMDEKSISRQHCWIEYDDSIKMYRFFDCSQNGVFLNHRKRLERKKVLLLVPGDELGFAKTQNVFKLG